MDDSFELSAATLVRKKALVAGARTSGAWGWFYPGKSAHATMGYEADLSDPTNAWLHHRVNEEPVDYKVRLVTTKPNYGGLRWWFICPLVRFDGGPPRRVEKL